MKKGILIVLLLLGGCGPDTMLTPVPRPLASETISSPGITTSSGEAIMSSENFTTLVAVGPYNRQTLEGTRFRQISPMEELFDVMLSAAPEPPGTEPE